MQYKTKDFSILISLILLFSIGCSFVSCGAKETAAPGVTGGQAEETQPVAPPAVGEGAAVAVLAEGNYQPVEVEIPFSGKIDFSIDSSKTAQVEYRADGSDVTLELTDGSGLTWKLVVPGIALGQAQTLKMTALSGLKSSNIPGELQGGILLEPDGLRLRVPATLTVSGEGLGDKIVLLTGAQDGSAMELTLPGEEVNSALIDHFSTAAGDWPGGSLDDFGKWLDEQDKAVIAEVKKFLAEHKNDIQVPVPPSIPIECADKNTPSSDQFLKDASQPESSLIGKLLSIKKAKALAGMGYDETFSLERQLASRLEQKARLLMKTYKGQEEKLIPVSQFALSIARQIALLWGDYDSTILEEIGQWCADTVDQLIKDITEKHDYRKVDAVWVVAKWAALLGNQSKTAGDIMSKLQGALLFKFQGTLNYSTLDSVWLLKSEFPLRLTIPEKEIWTGSGSGTTTYTNIKSAEITGESPPFVVNAMMNNFDACAGTANIVVDRFYADSDTIHIKDESATIPGVKNAWDFSFRNYKGSGLSWFDSGGGSIDGFKFPVTIHNLDVNAVNEKIEGETNCGDKCKVDFEIKLVHTPK